MRLVSFILVILGLALFQTANALETSSCGEDKLTVDGKCISCSEAVKIMKAKQDEIITKAAKGCSVDDDCSLAILNNECQGSCPVPLLVKNRFSSIKDLNLANSKYCAESNFQKYCAYATPNCIMTKPYCNKGVCELSNSTVNASGVTEEVAVNTLSNLAPRATV